MHLNLFLNLSAVELEYPWFPSLNLELYGSMACGSDVIEAGYNIILTAAE